MTVFQHTNRGSSSTEGYRLYLRRLGEHVRGLRVRRGMTRKLLAKNSDISERYLAKLEQGEGNISIVLLRQVAAAMNLPVAELLREDHGRAAELTLSIDLLKSLTTQQQQQAYELLLEQFDGSAARPEVVALIGLRGAGKTTLGRLLAEHFSVPFIRLGQAIEELAGMPLAEIFSLAGQAHYRQLEFQALKGILDRGKRVVLEVGGSIIVEPRTYNLLLSSCYTIWLQASPAEHMSRVMEQGDMRPMADNDAAMKDLKQMLQERQTFYSKANTSLDTSHRSVEALAAEIQERCQPILG